MGAISVPKLALYQAELRSDGPRRQGFLRVPAFHRNSRMGRKREHCAAYWPLPDTKSTTAFVGRSVVA
jgi:hypothetical protein